MAKSYISLLPDFVPDEDDAFPNRFNKLSYSKQRLQADMKKFTKAVDALLQAMFLLGQYAQKLMDAKTSNGGSPS